MTKKKKSAKVSRKPKQSRDVNRDGGGTKGGRSAATVRRLKVYRNRPKRDRKGRVLKHDFQSKKLPSTRIQPDPGFFANTRVVDQKKLELLREEMKRRMSGSYSVILEDRKWPLSPFK